MRPSVAAILRNPVSGLGVALTTACGFLLLALLALHFLGLLQNPYAGIVVFVFVPVLFVVGLLLIPIGLWTERRRKRAGSAAPAWPRLDLNDPTIRRTVLFVAGATLVNLAIVSAASFGAVEYTESPQFCGQVCHTTMQPEYAAYQVWPHARVACAACHVGPGAGALVESKLAGTRQLFQVMTGRVTRPIPSPVQSLRPARDTCEQCHWPEKVHGDRVRTIREYANDEGNTESVTTLQLHVGGGSRAMGIGTGIHWHMNLDNDIEYIASDDTRQSIPYVRLRDQQGRVREFVVEGTTPAQLSAGSRRRMDCMDCHNRPAHSFHSTPERAVDAAIGQGRIPRQLPFVRREAVAAVNTEYADKAAALDGIARRLRGFYAAREGVDGRLVDRAVTAAQDVWSRNVFPAMNVRWGTYPNHLGHVDTPGCFRCHDDEHKASDGSVIRQDCELCHDIE
ncbi:MAG: NapC/NirT family cytochrome c [Vicinamibacterales bacterium]